MVDIFIPSYHRANNLKTVKYLCKINYDMSRVYVFIDDEAEDEQEYRKVEKKYGFTLVVFSMEEARRRYDYIHRPSKSRRSAGQARNMMYDFAIENNIQNYCVMDDDTTAFEYRVKGRYSHLANGETVKMVFDMVVDMIRRHHIGIFGLSQTGDFYGSIERKIIRHKVMNTTFYDTRYIYRGERGVMDDDTSMFAGILNEGLFTGSIADGVTLKQTISAKVQGGLTDLYHENKLYNKAMIVPIQFPSNTHGEKQKMNGNRLHHKIKYRYLAPKLIKGKRSNIGWDTYPEDYPFTNEPTNRNDFTNLTTK